VPNHYTELFHQKRKEVQDSGLSNFFGADDICKQYQAIKVRQKYFNLER
jgi:hypothetical protein